MATYASLTDQQKSVLSANAPLFRASMVQYVKAINQMAALDQLWNNTVEPVVALLDPTEVIPDTNGLSGSDQLTHDDYITTMADVEQVLAAKNDANHKILYARICGLNNSIQTS